MADVVDSDELLRRVQRARDWAAGEEERWRARAGTGRSEGREVSGAGEAAVFASAYEAVRRVLDEVVTPGSNDPG